MQIETLHAPRRSTLIGFVAPALLLTFAAWAQLSSAENATPSKTTPRAQLSIGYSLLYQEADGIPKLKWIFMFKDKPEEMGRLTHDLVKFYQQLADTLQRLSKQYPRAMRGRPSARTSPKTSLRSSARLASNSNERRCSCFTTRSMSNVI
jgi:hypothetical protein